MSKTTVGQAGTVRCPLSMSVGARALAILGARGMTKGEIASAIGVSRWRFYRITTGRSSMSVVGEVMALADLCGMKTSELLAQASA